jgi:anti-sigma factor RsiW
MDTCGSYQEQLLDYLYDVLEGDEAQAVRQHLAACAACQEALRRAQGQQRLLATAARAEFPAVRFEAPADVLTFRAPAQTAPAPSRRRWLRIAVAAAVLLAVAGAAIPGGVYYRDYAATQQAVAHYRQQIADASKAGREAQARINQAAADRNESEAALRKAAQERQLKVVVSGPPTLQPGAPSQYEIQTRNLADAMVPARLTMRVRDAGQKVVYEEKDVATAGDYRLALPPSLPLKPNTQLALEVIARREGGPAEELHEQLSLAAPLYVAHLTTDKPIYRPGETVYYRALALDRFSFKPPDEDFTLQFKLRKPDGSDADLGTGVSEVVRKAGEAPLNGPDGKPLRGLASGVWAIDAGASGGEYTLLVSEAGNRFPPQERKFLINRYERQALNKELEWSRKSYGPGEDVLANCKVSLAEGGKPVANRPVIASIHIDGRFYGADGKPATGPLTLQTDAEGKVVVHFKLPPAESMSRGLGTLSVNFTDGANNESINKPIPITLNKLDVDFYPEGGDLVAGVPNRVYFQVHNMLGKPADLRGKIVDNTGKVACANVETLTVSDQPGANQGMGRFEFTPEAGKTYGLKITSPVGILGDHPLPAGEADKVALAVPSGVTNPGEPIRVTVQNPARDRSLLVGAYCRGRLMDHQRVTVKKGDTATVELRPAQEVGGVYRVTVFEEQPGAGKREQLRPLAERLVYRMPERRLNLAVQPDRKQYIPGDRATLTLRATDEKGQPAQAVVLVAVVDKSVITMADEKTARTMPTHFYLTSEVRKPEELEHADFLLTDHPKAKEALDLLLGTQGWRRFAEQDPAKFRNAHPEEAARLLVSIGQNGTKTTDFLKEGLERIDKDYQAAAVRLGHERDEAAAEVQKFQASADYAQALARLDGFERSFEKLRTQTLPLAAAAVLLALFVTLVVLIFRTSAVRSIPLYVGAATCAVLLVVVLFSQVGTKNGPAGGQPQVAMKPERPPMAFAAAPKGEARDFAEAAPPMPPAPRMEEDKPAAAPPPMEAPGAKMPVALAPVPPAMAPRRGAGGPPMNMKPMAIKGQAGAGQGMPMNRAQALGKRQNLLLQPMFEDEKAKQADGMDLRQRMGLAKDRFAKEQVEKKELQQRQLRDMGGLAVHERFVAGGIAAAKPAPPPQPFVVREYAHVRQPGATPDQRSDFTETLCWQPVLVLPDGKGEVSFGLSDSVTTFEVAAMGHTLDGRIGSVTATLASRLPFALAPKVPIEVTSSDRIDIPVSVSNSTAEPRDVSLHVTAKGLTLRDGGNGQLQLTVPAEGRVRRLFGFRPSLVEGQASLEVAGEAKQLGGDSIRRTFAVVPEGFPILAAHSDVLEKVLEQNVTLPATWVKGTLQLRADVYPSTLADLQKGLEALLREPGGCFEQTSTSNYPNLLILDYLKETDQAKPEVQQRALAMLDHGYHILTGYECPYDNQGRHGYEWFGSPNRGHEALTAYGLMEFRDMARVYKVDPVMLERTRKFLMDQRDGQGGFKRNPQALDTFGRAPQDITNAYVVWALTESGKEDDVSRELNALADQAKGSKDPYFLALVANGLLNRDRAAEAVALLKKIADAQKLDGHVDAERTSITGSGGRDLQIETTALAVLGWLKANRPAEFTMPLQKAIRWVGGQRGGYGGFGSTQSTILALKALIGYAKANKKTAQAGEVRLYVNDVQVAQKAFAAGAEDALTVALPEAEKHLHPGKNRVRVEITGDKNVFPCTVSWSYHTLQPPSAEGAPVRLSTTLDRDHADEGETLHLTVTVENTQAKGQSMAVAVVGLPAGLSLPEDLKQLKQHAELRNHGTERGLISYFETRGRELVLYWRDLAPNQKIEVPVDLICRVPGEYRGPASRAYLYYNSDTKFWTEPLRVAIRAKE